METRCDVDVCGTARMRTSTASFRRTQSSTALGKWRGFQSDSSSRRVLSTFSGFLSTIRSARWSSARGLTTAPRSTWHWNGTPSTYRFTNRVASGTFLVRVVLINIIRRYCHQCSRCSAFHTGQFLVSSTDWKCTTGKWGTRFILVPSFRYFGLTVSQKTEQPDWKMRNLSCMAGTRMTGQCSTGQCMTKFTS